MAIPRQQLLDELRIPLDKIFNEEYEKNTPYSLVQVTLKDGSVREIIASIRPSAMHSVAREVHETGMLCLSNGDSALAVMADMIKSITVMKFTKE
jgi:hypothetical protein